MSSIIGAGRLPEGAVRGRFPTTVTMYPLGYRGDEIPPIMTG